MRAMILAAGRGERMRPLTDSLPKPLFEIGPCSLLEHHIHNLKKSGVNNIVINTGWLGQKILDQLGNGEKLGVNIKYSVEGYPALETAGGIINALPLLGTKPFIVVNGDIFCDFDFSILKIEPSTLAHLILVPNPSQHNKGDFSLSDGMVRIANSGTTYTFSGIALYKTEFFSQLDKNRLALRPVFDKAISAGYVGGQVYKGLWHDIGTPERLKMLQRSFAKK